MSCSGRLISFGIIPQPRKEKLTSPIRVLLEETDEWIKLKGGGIYEPVEDPILDDLSHLIAHEFIGKQTELTVIDIKNILAGIGSDKEIREALRALAKKEVVEA